MNEASNHTAFFRGLRQMFGVTLILLLLCGFVFPVLLTGISSMVFPAQPVAVWSMRTVGPLDQNTSDRSLPNHIL